MNGGSLYELAKIPGHSNINDSESSLSADSQRSESRYLANVGSGPDISSGGPRHQLKHANDVEIQTSCPQRGQ
jgi:hypothetical protein